MPRGGRRSGTPGKAYSNRVDLNRPAPGQQYGKATAQQQALKAVPMQHQPEPPSGGAPSQAPDLMGMAEGWNPLNGSPTQDPNPDKPVTAGLDIGAGPGSDVLPTIQPPPNPDMAKLIRMLPLLEQMANSPGASTQTRQVYRQTLAAYLHTQG